MVSVQRRIDKANILIGRLIPSVVLVLLRTIDMSVSIPNDLPTLTLFCICHIADKVELECASLYNKLVARPTSFQSLVLKRGSK